MLHHWVSEIQTIVDLFCGRFLALRRKSLGFAIIGLYIVEQRWCMSEILHAYLPEKTLYARAMLSVFGDMRRYSMHISNGRR